MKKKRTRKPLTPEQRARHAELERKRRKLHAELAEAERIRFTCAECGGEFVVPDGPTSTNEESKRRAFVRLGGRVVCEVCARERFRRKYNVWGMNPDAIPTSAF